MVILNFFVFRTVELRFVCNNHAIQPSILFHMAIFLPTGDLFSILSYFCFLNNDFHRPRVRVSIMLQATARWEAFFSQIFPSESPCHYLGEICCYALYYYRPLKSFRRSNCSVWIMSVRLIHLMVSQLEVL